ncbi:MAG TPA: enolase C-terminal domain-like protein [Streptosporangiaceae bacterium]
MKITSLTVEDVRFPTSRHLDGSDAMNPDPDYSAAYVVLHTGDPDGLGGAGAATGHGFCFTIGRGNEVCVAAIEAYRPLVAGYDLDLADLGGFARRLLHDSQLRWLGPEKGPAHMAAGAIINAAFDLAGKVAGKPVWKLLADMAPEQVVDLADWRYLTDALAPDAAAGLLRAAAPGKADREARLRAGGYPAYTTTPGWLGYPDDDMVRLARAAVSDGFTLIKLKVGADVRDDVRRLALARAAVGAGVRIAVDANQRWDVGQAVEWVAALRPYDPWWIEEPTSPDDVLGQAAIKTAIAPLKVASGEHVANRVIFKQLLQAGAIDFLQLDACRVAGVTENVAILLLAAAYGVPVCPHAGGVGLCEVVQHLAMFDYVAVSGELTDRTVEYVDHLHEHFVDPVRVANGRYRVPERPGLSTEMRAESRAAHAFPDGPAWRVS